MHGLQFNYMFLYTDLKGQNSHLKEVCYSSNFGSTTYAEKYVCAQ